MDRVKEAIDLGFHTIGISEHGPQPHLRGNRLSMDGIEEYFDAVGSAKKAFGHLIDIKCGFEMEWFPEHKEFYTRLRNDPRCDYFVLGQHFIWEDNDFHWAYMAGKKSNFKKYLAEIDEALGTGMFSFIAHPDLVVSGPRLDFETRKRVAHQLLDVLQKHDAVVELNGHGIRSGKGYPIRPFWQLVKERNMKVIINADSHDFNTLNDYAMVKACEMANELELDVTDII